MRICVLGAGVIGVTTAYFLAKDGHDVTIVDRNGLSGQEASYANGGQLSYSYVAPLASPSVLQSLPKYLFSKESPLRLRFRANLAFVGWAIHFLQACRPSRFRQRVAELSSLAYHSRDVLNDLLLSENVEFDYQNSGKLVIYRSARALQMASRLAELQKEFGAEQQLLDAKACVDLEPALADLRSIIAGGVFTPSEDVGDCHKFCRPMDELLNKKYNVTRLYNHKIGAIATRERRVLSVATDRGAVEADLFVVAAGIGSREMLRPVGLRLPLYALKGYSLTMPIDNDSAAPKISVTDSDNKIVYARLGGNMRAAAMVDMGVPHGAVDMRRISTLRRHIHEAFPRLGGSDNIRPWAGQRPATAQGKPVIGQTPFENLFVNVGHGALGFTLAAGSGKLTADLIQGRTPAIDPSPFSYGVVR
jgi:D-amino-acid dehydrogenase